MARPSDEYPELTDHRLSLIAGIYVTVWRAVLGQRSALSMPLELGMSRYCRAARAYELAQRAYPWLRLFKKGLYYHLRIGGAGGAGEVVLRVDRLDGELPAALQQLTPASNPDFAQHWLPDIPDARTPHLRLEVDGRAEQMPATLRLLTAGSDGDEDGTELRRWEISVADVTIAEIHGWSELPQVAPGFDEPATSSPVVDAGVSTSEPPPATFEIISKRKRRKAGEEQ